VRQDLANIQGMRIREAVDDGGSGTAAGRPWRGGDDFKLWRTREAPTAAIACKALAGRRKLRHRPPVDR
jgi:hypothetical protein